MVVTLESMIKRIRMNGGKTAPLIATAIELLSNKVNIALGQIESSRDHKIFWRAVNECRKAGDELSAARHATGFITREELEGELKRSDFETFLWCAATAAATALGVLLAVRYG